MTCTVQEDTVCRACTVCDFAQQIETHKCNENSANAACAPINFGHSCLPGSVAGNHTRYLQPHCLACVVRASDNPVDHWFDFTLPGSAYAIIHSCGVRCRGFSRLRDAVNHSRGCQSCETSNVLFQDMGSGCNFTCQPGYPPSADGSDCEQPVLQQRAGMTLLFMRLSNWAYEADGHNITVAHVDRVQALRAGAPWRTTGHGNANRLFSFMAQGTAGALVAVSLKRLLVAHTMANLTALPAVVLRLLVGCLAFDYGFREWCRAHRGCKYEYITVYAHLRGNLLRVDCADRAGAREWLRLAIRAAHDAGHVDAVCALVARRSAQHAVAYLAAAGHVLNRQEWAEQAYSTLLWPQFEFKTLVS